MNRIARQLAASVAALLLIGGFAMLLETLALAWAFAGQVIAPYDFFTTQAYDFLAKLRWYGDAVLAWAPALPDRFLGTSLGDHLRLAPLLAPAVFTTAVVTGLVGGLPIAVALRGRRASVRGWILGWTAFGLLVHAAATVPPLNLDELSAWSQVTYRLRSVVVDGAALAMAVALASGACAWLAAPLLARGRGMIAAGAGAAGLAAFGLALAGGDPSQAALAAFEPKAAATPPYNVLLISLDSLRADRVGAYGHHRDTSPTIDRLADEGIRFDRAISTSSWTLPTHLTMFTSRYQISHGVTHDTMTLAPSVPTLGEVLSTAGYATAGFISGPYVAGHYGYARGMDTYVDLSKGYDHRREARETISSPAINDHALEWLADHKDQRFFLFLHYFDIHYDFVPPPPYDTMFDPDYTGTMDGTRFIERPDVNRRMDPRDLEHILALYDGEIRFTDEHVGRIISRLEEYGVLDETLVILVSDHGDEFFEHGNKGHHRTVYDEVLHIPFVVRLPGARDAGTVVDEQVSLVDVMPTILDFIGLEGPPDMEGHSVLSFVDGDGPDRDAVYAEFFDKRGFNLQVARRTPETKVIQHFNRITHPKRHAVELYAVNRDPGEQSDLADERDELASAELDAMADWLQDRWKVQREFRRRAGDAQGGVEIDDEMAERLRSLGYVGDH